MAHEHVVTDSDSIFLINPKSRVIENTYDKECVVQFDHNSERFTFRVPRFIDGHDMSLCNYIEVNYVNTTEGTKVQHYGSYVVNDLHLDPDNDDSIILTWLIDEDATQQVGTLDFSVRFICANDDLKAEYKWSTAIYTGIKVLKGMPDTLEESMAEVVSLNTIEQVINESGVIEYDANF